MNEDINAMVSALGSVVIMLKTGPVKNEQLIPILESLQQRADRMLEDEKLRERRLCKSR